MPVLEYTAKRNTSIHRKRRRRTAAVAIVLAAFLFIGSSIVFWDKLFPTAAPAVQEPVQQPEQQPQTEPVAIPEQQPQTEPVAIPEQELPAEPVVSPTVPIASLSDIPAEDQKYLLLASKENPLPDGYTPLDIAAIPGSIYKMDKTAGESLAKMLPDMKAAGITGMEVKSAYRTYEKQKQLYEAKVTKLTPQYSTLEEAQTAAAQIVAYPGTSEHQTGFAADVSNMVSLEESFGDTKAGKWLAAHCSEYGFIIRYPNGKSDYTVIIYEPWHLRYVGNAAAAYITQNDLCLEEFLDRYQPTVN
jgi:D-alanyl-D-alanine carboxypeptidase